MKRPDIAVAILKSLVDKDPTGEWRLVIAGPLPTSFPWMEKRPLELEYYLNFTAAIEGAGLRDRVQFDGIVNSTDWFSSVGYILSCSDFEVSHQAVAEGMASGCIPIVRNWPGAELIYPSALIFETPEQAADLILTTDISVRKNSRVSLLELTQSSFKQEVEDRFSTPIFTKSVNSLILPKGLLSVFSLKERVSSFHMNLVKVRAKQTKEA